MIIIDVVFCMWGEIPHFDVIICLLCGKDFMMIEKQITLFRGKHYSTKPVDDNICEGCAFIDEYESCTAHATDMTTHCYEDNFIWKEVTEEAIKKEQMQSNEIVEKYTVEQFMYCLVSLELVGDHEKDDIAHEIGEKIKIFTDPDYVKYMELKEKFKGI